jgi:hypothetical protein
MNSVFPPTQSKPRRLPPELIDSIIELLRADRAALKMCALVCRSWVPASRHYLSFQVILNRKSVITTSKIILATTCTIASAIQHLILDGIADWREVRETALDLCHLKRVTFHNTLLWRAPLRGVGPLLHHLENLYLKHVTLCFSPEPFLNLLRHTPRLQRLSCCNMHWFGESNANRGDRNNGGDGDNNRTSRAYQSLPLDLDELVPLLKSLQVHMSPRFRLLQWLMERWTITVPPLTMLDLDGHPHDFGAQLSALGLSLQVLRLSICPGCSCEWSPP